MHGDQLRETRLIPCFLGNTCCIDRVIQDNEIMRGHPSASLELRATPTIVGQGTVPHALISHSLAFPLTDTVGAIMHAQYTLLVKRTGLYQSKTAPTLPPRSESNCAYADAASLGEKRCVIRSETHICPRCTYCRKSCR